MKAIRFHEHGGPEVLRYEDVPDPIAGPGQVLLRVLAAGVELGGYIRDGRLRLQLGGTYKLAQAVEAHRAIEGRGTTGKIVLVR